MASVFAIIDRASFERDAPNAAVGDVLPIASYASNHDALAPVANRGALLLATVRPDGALWLVAVLERPQFTDGAWTATPNRVPIVDVTKLARQLVFESGAGIDRSALVASLATPRQLTLEDVALLRGAVLGGADTIMSLAGAGEAQMAQTEMAPVALRAPKRPFHKARRGRVPRVKPPTLVPVGPRPATLADITTALDAGCALVALDTALEVWRAQRAVELAELVELIGAQVDRSMPALHGVDVEDVHVSWMATARTRRTADVGRLLAQLSDATPAMLTERCRVLAELRPDPRITLVALEATARVDGDAPFAAACALAIAMGDGRAARLIGKLLGRGLRSSPRIREAERTRAVLAEPPELRDTAYPMLGAAQRALEQLASRPPATEAELLAQRLPSR